MGSGLRAWPWFNRRRGACRVVFLVKGKADIHRPFILLTNASISRHGSSFVLIAGGQNAPILADLDGSQPCHFINKKASARMRKPSPFIPFSLV